MNLHILHPRWFAIGTSMGRWASANPNAQNFPARGPMSPLRDAVIPRDPSLQLIGGDYAQIEFRRVLHLAGYDLRKLPADAFTWFVEQTGDDLNVGAQAAYSELYATDPKKSKRNVAKRITHAYDYLEGFTILSPKESYEVAHPPKDVKKGTYLQRSHAAGALLLLGDWQYGGGTVGFTGANLAQTLFGSKTFEFRAKALRVQEIVTSRFPSIREWQKSVTQWVQRKGYVQSCTGRYLELHGTDYEKAKYACAFFGQGESADFVQAHMVRLWKENGRVPILQGHDELIYEGPKEWDRREVVEALKGFEEESCIKGFVVPMKFKMGPSWGRLEEFGRDES